MSRAPNAARRSESSRRAILTATAELCSEDGYGRLTIEAIATRAGVSKKTIYRWWPSKGAVVLELLDEAASVAVDPPDTGDLATDLRALLTEVIGLLTPPHNSPAIGLIAEALHDPDLARDLRERLIQPRIATFKERLRRAQETGQLPRTPTSTSRSTCCTARSTTAWPFISACPTPATSIPSSPTSCARSPRRRPPVSPSSEGNRRPAFHESATVQDLVAARLRRRRRRCC